MLTILLNSLGILLVLAISFSLKKIGLFKQKDGDLLSRLIIYVTLPAALIIGVNNTKLSSMYFVLMAIGIGSNILLVFIGKFLGRKEDEKGQALYMFNLSGYNIGNFAIPFVSGLLPAATPFLAMFDMGNAVMVSGGTQALVESTTKKNRYGFIVRDVFLILIKNPPFVVYILMFFMAVFSLSFPENWLAPIRPIASANTLLSIFTIGLFMEFKLPKGKMKMVIKILASRYFLALVFSAIIYFLAPFPELVKKALLLVLFCPMSFMHMIQATAFGNEKSLTGLIISLSMFISLILMSIVAIIL